MTDEEVEYTVGDAQAEILKAIVGGSIAARLSPDQTASVMKRLAEAISRIPVELRGEALSPDLFEGVSRNLVPGLGE